MSGVSSAGGGVRRALPTPQHKHAPAKVKLKVNGVDVKAGEFDIKLRVDPLKPGGSVEVCKDNVCVKGEGGPDGGQVGVKIKF